MSQALILNNRRLKPHYKTAAAALAEAAVLCAVTLRSSLGAKLSLKFVCRLGLYGAGPALLKARRSKAQTMGLGVGVDCASAIFQRSYSLANLLAVIGIINT